MCVENIIVLNKDLFSSFCSTLFQTLNHTFFSIFNLKEDVYTNFKQP